MDEWQMSKRILDSERTVERRGAFGVRPACWRFGTVRAQREREQAPRTPNASRRHTHFRESARGGSVCLALCCRGSLSHAVEEGARWSEFLQLQRRAGTALRGQLQSHMTSSNALVA